MKLRFRALNKIIKIVEEEASLADSLEVIDVEYSELPMGSPSFAKINSIDDEQEEQGEFEEERTALNINSISEVKDCADMVAEMFGHIHQNDSVSLKFATKLMKGIFHRIQEDEILLQGLEVEHISAYSDALMRAGEYHDAFDLLFFVSEYPKLYSGITSKQVARLAKFMHFNHGFEQSDIEEDEDNDTLVQASHESRINYKDLFLAVMNVAEKFPEWTKDIRPELWEEEYDILKKHFNSLAEQEAWVHYIYEIEIRSH